MPAKKRLKFYFHAVIKPEPTDYDSDPFATALEGIRELTGTALTMNLDGSFLRLREVRLLSSSNQWLGGRFARYATDMDVVIGDTAGGERFVQLDDSHGAQSPESFFLYDRGLKVLCFQHNAAAHLSRFERYVEQVAPTKPKVVHTEMLLNEDFLKQLQSADRIIAMELSTVRPTHGDFYHGSNASLRDFSAVPAGLEGDVLNAYVGVKRRPANRSLDRARVIPMVQEILRIRQSEVVKIKSAKVYIDDGSVREVMVNLFKAAIEREAEVTVERRRIDAEEVYSSLGMTYADAVPEVTRILSMRG